MTIKLPASAKFGYYYEVMFNPITTNPLQDNQNALKSENAVLVLVNAVTGGQKQGLQIVNFKTSKNLYEYLPATFDIKISNTSNIYFKSVGNIYINRDSTFSNIIDTIPVNSSNGNVLPQSDRLFPITWSDGFPIYQTKMLGGQPVVDKHNIPVQQLRWNFSNLNNFRFGKYYARLVLVYNNGQGDQSISQDISFWVVPWPLLLIGFLIAVFIFAGLYGFGRFIYRRIHHIATRKKK
jgi:hypothetical protein